MEKDSFGSSERLVARILRSVPPIALLSGMAMLFPGRIAVAGAPASSLHPQPNIHADKERESIAYDDNSHFLYIAEDSLMVVRKFYPDSVAHSNVPGVGRVHHVALDQEHGYGFVTSGTSGDVFTFTLKNPAVVEAPIRAGRGADFILYDAHSHELFTMDDSSQTATSIDPKPFKVRGTIPLGGSPGAAVADGAGKIYVLLKCNGKDVVAEIDEASRTVTRRWGIAPGRSAAGLALDAVDHQLFVTCQNHLLVILDTSSGGTVRTRPIDECAGDCVFDARSGSLYAACGGGTGSVAIVPRYDSGDFGEATYLPTAENARIVALNGKGDRLFLVTSDSCRKATAGCEHPPRDEAKAGTFTLLVLEP